MGKEDEIRLIAYNIWEEEGCLYGHDCEHWFRAEAIWGKQKQGTGSKGIKTEAKRVNQKNPNDKIVKKKP